MFFCIFKILVVKVVNVGEDLIFILKYFFFLIFGFGRGYFVGFYVFGKFCVFVGC